MAYHVFTKSILKEQFGVEQVFQAGLFSHLASRLPSPLLAELLSKTVDFALAQGSEKARSEYIIAPVFWEVREQTERRISVFSGIRFDVDRKRKLEGWCDFLVSRSPYQSELEAPVIIAVEAKQQNFTQGTNQCIAEMIAARIYNEQHGVNVTEIYGCVTTGDGWRFLMLRGSQAYIDTVLLDIHDDLARILGLLYAMSLGEVPDIQ